MFSESGAFKGLVKLIFSAFVLKKSSGQAYFPADIQAVSEQTGCSEGALIEFSQKGKSTMAIYDELKQTSPIYLPIEGQLNDARLNAKVSHHPCGDGSMIHMPGGYELLIEMGQSHNDKSDEMPYGFYVNKENEIISAVMFDNRSDKGSKTLPSCLLFSNVNKGKAEPIINCGQDIEQVVEVKTQGQYAPYKQAPVM